MSYMQVEDERMTTGLKVGEEMEFGCLRCNGDGKCRAIPRNRKASRKSCTHSL